MNDFPPPPDDQQLSESQRRELFKCIAELCRITAEMNATIEHVYPKPGSTIDLANRLRKARELAADKRPVEELSEDERVTRNGRLKAVKELDRMYKEATETSDAADRRGFFYRLSEASKLSDDEMAQPLDSYGLTVGAEKKRPGPLSPGLLFKATLNHSQLATAAAGMRESSPEISRLYRRILVD